MLIHSLVWVGAALIADPQRLILGIPWYLNIALSLGLFVAVAWLNLLFRTIREKRSFYAVATYALYFPVLWMWNVFPQ